MDTGNEKTIEILRKSGGIENIGETAKLVKLVKNNRPLNEIKTALASCEANVRDIDGKTALIAATESNNIQAVKLLLKSKADVNAKDENGETALFIASGQNKNLEIIKTLLKAKADVNAKHYEDGAIALFHAIGNDNPEVIKALLKAGAKVNTQTKSGTTALMVAVRFITSRS